MEKHCSDTFKTPSDPSLYVHSVVGTERYTTSTTNMYKTSRTLSTGFLNVKIIGIRHRRHTLTMSHCGQLPEKHTEDQHEEIGDKAENVGQGKGKAAHVDLGVQQSFRHQHGCTGGGA